MEHGPWALRDEQRHDGAPVEAWWWWMSAQTDDGLSGAFVGFELRGRRYDYWAGLVREGHPYLYIEELDGADLRSGLEIKPPQMWADHVCDAPFRQWSIGNEAHGVLLDDPTEAWRRAFGDVVPVTFDVEWHADGEPQQTQLPIGANGYSQRGEADARIELEEGVLALVGPASRVHVWGVGHLPTSLAMPIDQRGLRAPYRRTDGIRVDQVLTDAGWWVSR